MQVYWGHNPCSFLPHDCGRKHIFKNLKKNKGIAEVTYCSLWWGRTHLPWSFIYILMVKLRRFTDRLYVWYDSKPWMLSHWKNVVIFDLKGRSRWSRFGKNRMRFQLAWREGLEKAMAPHSSTLAWKIAWMEEPGGLQSMGLLRVGHDWGDLAAAREGERVRCNWVTWLSLSVFNSLNMRALLK